MVGAFQIVDQIYIMTGGGPNNASSLLLFHTYLTAFRFGDLGLAQALTMRQTFRQVPLDLDDAARLDGANWWQILRHVYLPPARRALIAFGLVSVISTGTTSSGR